MVDFNRRLDPDGGGAKPIEPAEIWEKSDRESDTGPLRPAQISVLEEWHNNRRTDRDVIVKMHTGQGKTLIGLLILQSKLNELNEPALYICPNKNLAQQTLQQAQRFGIKCCTAETDLPEAFADAEQILVTYVQKVFNGLTKFRLGPQSQTVGALVMDDCHACIDSIRGGVKITVPRAHSAYQPLLALFGSDLKEQGGGTFADIEQGDYSAFLPVPYWAWVAHHHDVAGILAKYAKTNEVKFAWPLIKDTLEHCSCLISGTSLEIEAAAPPLDVFGTYEKAKHRVFMSATVTNDAFLVKGLGLAPDVIRNPLLDKKEKWSGEKMILMLSLMDSSLGRDFVIKALGKPQKRPFGVVVITPSFKVAEDWTKVGAKCPSSETIDASIEDLRQGKTDEPVVIANRYDGIDLPDNACRVLIIDSKPQGETLMDRWSEVCRAESEVTLIKMARTIEQGLGRSVRGEKDYSVILMIGADLVKQFRAKHNRKYFSEQTQTQISIGMKIMEFAKEDIAAGKKPNAVFIELMNQCLKRDSGWKTYYDQQMSKIANAPAVPAALEIFTAEHSAELLFRSGKPQKAIDVLQALLDREKMVGVESGWYLQEMARYAYSFDKAHANELQVAAHKRNRYLLRPQKGMEFETISAVGQKRIERLVAWIKQFDSGDDLGAEIEAITANLRFGVAASDFEAAFDQLGKALGFVTQRPDKELREGPDNLWALRDNHFWLVECKNQVDVNRKEINKQETGQMNNSCAWFKQHYPGATKNGMMVIWTKVVGASGGFNDNVGVMTNKSLEKLVKNAREFFGELKAVDLHDISEIKLQENLDRYSLTVDELVSNYSEEPVIQ